MPRVFLLYKSLSYADDLIYLWLLKQMRKGILLYEVEDVVEAILYLHCALQTTVYIVRYQSPTEDV